jgi:hypothetical protein
VPDKKLRQVATLIGSLFDPLAALLLALVVAKCGSIVFSWVVEPEVLEGVAVEAVLFSVNVPNGVGPTMDR